ncbi:MAG: GNAT family N-acetyltransferase [Christensenellales bacterium]
MKYSIKRTVGICDDSRYIRHIVFEIEQGFQDKFDDVDGWADTIVFYDSDGSAIATGRVFLYDQDNSIYKLGRIAVVKQYRKHGLGAEVVKELEKIAIAQGARTLLISAQVRSQGFYEKCGYVATDEKYYEEHVPHVKMLKPNANF